MSVLANKEALVELRAIRAAIEMLTRAVLRDELPETACPQCLVTSPDKIVPSPVMGESDRMSCLACGHSWRSE